MTDETIDNQPELESVVDDNVEVQEQPEAQPKAKPGRPPKQTVDPDEFERTRAALAKANKEAADRRLKLKEWEELNVDPTTVKQLLDMQRELEIKKAEEEGRYQENIDRLRKEAQEKIEKANGQVETMKQKLERQIKMKEIASIIAEEDGIELILEPHISNRVKMVEREDGYELQVTDENGVPMIDDKGNSVSLKSFVASLKEHPQLKYGFKAPKTSGSGINGTSTSNKSDGVPKGVRRSQLSDREARDFVAKYGFDEYKKLPK